MSSPDPSPEAKRAFFLELCRLDEESSGSEYAQESQNSAHDRRRWREALRRRNESNKTPTSASPSNAHSNLPVTEQSHSMISSQNQARPLQELPPTTSQFPRPPLAVLNPRRTASSPSAPSRLPAAPLSDPIDSSNSTSSVRAPLQPITLTRSATMPNPPTGRPQPQRRPVPSQSARPSSGKRKRELKLPDYKGPLFLKGFRLFLIRDDGKISAFCCHVLHGECTLTLGVF